LILLPKFQKYTHEILRVYPQLASYIDLSFKTLSQFLNSKEETIKVLPEFTATFERFIEILPRMLINKDIVLKAMPRLKSYSEQFITIIPKLAIYTDYTEQLFQVFSRTTAVLAALFQYINLGTNQTLILSGGIML
jgi:hypothetical protein